jgi:lipoprotein NlpI
MIDRAFDLGITGPANISVPGRSRPMSRTDRLSLVVASAVILYVAAGLCCADDGAQSPETYLARAAADASQGHFDQAIGEMDHLLKRRPDDAEAHQFRGELHFKAGHISASIQDFDRVLELRPERLPHHWQRGISYYYAGQYQQGVRQFESHQRVNPQDIENAVWHYLCKAKLEGVAQARAALINITSDRRPWAPIVYNMYQGRATPEEVLAQAGQAGRTEAERRDSLFYAHLYVGLFHEAAGQSQQALEHIEIAVQKYLSPHYMGDVARVHLQLRKANGKAVEAVTPAGTTERRRLP